MCFVGHVAFVVFAANCTCTSLASTTASVQVQVERNEGSIGKEHGIGNGIQRFILSTGTAC